MSSIKDGFDIGVEALQFWLRFKGRRVRIWPSELTLRVDVVRQVVREELAPPMAAVVG